MKKGGNESTSSIRSFFSFYLSTARTMQIRESWVGLNSTQPSVLLFYDLLHFHSPFSVYSVSIYSYCRLISDVDLQVVTFTDFGKNIPKSFKLSPDGFIQIAIQLAYYK